MTDVLPSGERVEEPSDFGGLRPGARLGRYELLIPVARGGMARVWAARQHGQRGFQKLVAIKTILPQLAEEPDFERMFLDEARIASGVHHPNVCEIYELGDEQGTLYLAMEWVSGDSLARLLRASGSTEAIDPRVAARILADACAGVHAAHELTDDDGRQLGVVHRDVSPQNVLLTADGVVKVCDFGVAKALGQLHDHTSAGQLKGKISYMSPEQVRGTPLDRRSDVFALGCVLYEATTGTRPFKGAREHIVMQAILSGDLERPSSIVPGYPQELERIVLRALSHEPILRYPTAERMRFALEEFLARGPLVTQANVAQVVRERLGEQIERRKERIRHASSAAEQPAWTSAHGGSRDVHDHRSGVKTASRVGTPTDPPSHAARASRPDAVPALMPGEAIDDEATIHGHGLGPSAPMGPLAGELPQEVPSAVPRPPMPSSAGHGLGPAFVPPPPSAVPPAVAGAPVNPFASTAVYDVGSAPSSSGARGPAGTREYLVAVLAGVLVAMAISGAVGFVVLRARAPEVWDDPAPPSASSAPVEAPSTVHGAAPSASPVAPSASPVAPAGDILIEVSPEHAILVVDGRELAAGDRSVPRPAEGKSAIVVVRANGYGDAILTVDSSTPTPLVVALDLAPVDTDTPGSEDAPGEPSAGRRIPAEAPRAPVKPRPKDTATELPENPY